MGSCPPESNVCLNFLDLTNDLNCGNMSRRTDPYRMWVKGYWYGTIKKDDLEGVTGCHPVRHFCRVSRAKPRTRRKIVSLANSQNNFFRFESVKRDNNSKGFKICNPSKRSKENDRSQVCCRVQNYFKTLQKCLNRHPVCN